MPVNQAGWHFSLDGGFWRSGRMYARPAAVAMPDASGRCRDGTVQVPERRHPDG
jgi:hypothetical protein